MKPHVQPSHHLPRLPSMQDYWQKLRSVNLVLFSVSCLLLPQSYPSPCLDSSLSVCISTVECLNLLRIPVSVRLVKLVPLRGRFSEGITLVAQALQRCIDEVEVRRAHEQDVTCERIAHVCILHSRPLAHRGEGTKNTHLPSTRFLGKFFQRVKNTIYMVSQNCWLFVEVGFNRSHKTPKPVATIAHISSVYPWDDIGTAASNVAIVGADLGSSALRSATKLGCFF